MKTAIVCVPAHNEKQYIEECVRCLKAQTYPTDVLVCCDRCSDNTEELAISAGAMTIHITENTGMRSGALNKGLDIVLDKYDYVMAFDADSICDPHLIEEGVKVLEANPKLAGVCSRAGVCVPKNPKLMESILYHLQNVEYGDYDSSRIECGNSIKVLHGLATLFRVEALRELKAERGYVYDENALVEDYMLTLDLKKRGWQSTTSLNMLAYTVVPDTWKSLWAQRNRWLLGGIDCLLAHGFNRFTYWDWFNQGLFAVLFSINVILTALMVIILAGGGNVEYSSYIMIVYGAAYLDGMYRLKYVQNRTWKDILIKALFLPYMMYGFMHMAGQVNAYYLYLMRAKRCYED
jgi:biofilm PGA synthesis N-glycosyltransferase PgaC